MDGETETREGALLSGPGGLAQRYREGRQVELPITPWLRSGLGKSQGQAEKERVLSLLREPCPHIHPQSDFKVRLLEQLRPLKIFIESRAGLVRS